MTKEKHLYRILFLTSISLLLINDLYLKYEYHNYLTGKLSDFAGLFAFPYFFSCLFPNRINPIYILSGILFVLWKSEFSQPFFDFAHDYGIGIDRTIDYSDLISLTILPISFNYWKANFKEFIKLNKAFKPAIIGVSCFAFIATSVPSKIGEINQKADYDIDIRTTHEILKNSNLYFLSLKNNKHLSRLEIPERKAVITLSLVITEKEDGILNIKLDSILDYRVIGSTMIFAGGVDQEDIDYVKNLTVSDFESLFIIQKIKPIRQK
ncbi:MAG: hypothetical protein R2776_06345 [Flavobacteriaceae bacterium]